MYIYIKYISEVVFLYANKNYWKNKNGLFIVPTRTNLPSKNFLPQNSYLTPCTRKVSIGKQISISIRLDYIRPNQNIASRYFKEVDFL